MKKTDFINLSVVAKPNSKKEGLSVQNGLIAAKLATPPVYGKANQRLVELLSKALKIPKTKIIVSKGQTSKNKVLTIFTQLTAAEILKKLGESHD